MKKLIITFLLTSLLCCFAQGKGPFDSFLIRFLEKNKTEVLLMAKAEDGNIRQLFIIGPKSMDGIVIEVMDKTVVNVFSYHWDPDKTRFSLGDVEGGEQAIARARKVLDKLKTVSFVIIQGDALHAEIWK